MTSKVKSRPPQINTSGNISPSDAPTPKRAKQIPTPQAPQTPTRPNQSRLFKQESKTPLAIEISAVISEEKTATAKGQLLGAEHKNVYKYEDFIQWEGKRYLVTLDIPIIPGQTTEEQLKGAIRMHLDLFTADLSKHKTDKLKPGRDFNFVFTQDGYTAYVPNKKIESYDFATHSLEEIFEAAKIPETDYVRGDSKEAKALAEIMNKPSEMIKAYEKHLELKEQSAKQAEGATFRPVGFPNKGNSCYLAAALQTWASNPLIRGELLKPDVIKDTPVGRELRSILEHYDDAQRDLTKLHQIDLSKLQDLLFPGKVQQDSSEALTRLLQNGINIDRSSLLCTQIQSNWSYSDPETNEEKWAQAPQESSQIARKTITLTENASLETLLKDQLTGDLDESIGTIPGTDTQVSRLRIKETFDEPPRILTIQANRFDNNLKKIKDPIQVDLTLKLPGSFYGKEEASSTEYDLMSFCSHVGEERASGHYRAYVRDGDHFYVMDDGGHRKIEEDEFLKAAQTAYFYTYNKKGLTVDQATSVKSAIPPDLTHIKEELVNHTKIRTGVGDIQSRPGIIVDFRNISPNENNPKNLAKKVTQLLEKHGGENKKKQSLDAIISFAIPEGIGQSRNARNLMLQAMKAYAEKVENTCAFKTIEIVLTKQQNDIIENSKPVKIVPRVPPVPPVPPVPSAPPAPQIKVEELADKFEKIIKGSEDPINLIFELGENYNESINGSTHTYTFAKNWDKGTIPLYALGKAISDYEKSNSKTKTISIKFNESFFNEVKNFYAYYKSHPFTKVTLIIKDGDDSELFRVEPSRMHKAWNFSRGFAGDVLGTLGKSPYEEEILTS